MTLCTLQNCLQGIYKHFHATWQWMVCLGRTCFKKREGKWEESVSFWRKKENNSLEQTTAKIIIMILPNNAQNRANFWLGQPNFLGSLDQNYEIIFERKSTTAFELIISKTRTQNLRFVLERFSSCFLGA